MTTNQINYWTLKEQERSNRMNESIKQDELSEKKRSNVRNELLKLLDYTDNPIALGLYLASNGLNADSVSNIDLNSLNLKDVFKEVSDTSGVVVNSVKDLFSSNIDGLGYGAIPKAINSIFS